MHQTQLLKNSRLEGKIEQLRWNWALDLSPLCCNKSKISRKFRQTKSHLFNKIFFFYRVLCFPFNPQILSEIVQFCPWVRYWKGWILRAQKEQAEFFSSDPFWLDPHPELYQIPLLVVAPQSPVCGLHGQGFPGPKTNIVGCSFVLLPMKQSFFLYQCCRPVTEHLTSTCTDVGSVTGTQSKKQKSTKQNSSAKLPAPNPAEGKPFLRINPRSVAHFKATSDLFNSSAGCVLLTFYNIVVSLCPWLSSRSLQV